MASDAGLIWLHALSGVGNNIADAMQQYHKEHQAYDQQSQIADALSRIGINPQGQLTSIDPANPDKTIQPVIDQKAAQLFQTNVHDQQVKNTGAMEAINRIGLHMIGTSATAASQLKLQQARMDSPLNQARTQNVQMRTTKTQLDIAKQLGLIPDTTANKVTGGQIMNYQLQQQKIAIGQQGKIEKSLAAQNINDPNVLLNSQNWVYGGMQKSGLNRGTLGALGSAQPSFVPNSDPNDYVKIPGVRNPMPVDQAMGLQKKAMEWQKHSQAAQQQPLAINPPQASIQRLMTNPTPQIKAMFDQAFGQGAADIVINSQGVKDPNAQQQAAPAPTPEPDTTADDTAPVDE
jgi:hypothetical protein